MTEGEGGDGRDFGDEAVNLLPAAGGVLDVLGFGVEGRERGDHRLEHPHRVRAVVEAVQNLLDVLVDEGVVRDVPLPLLQLLGGREFAVQQQVCDFEVVALFGELFDGVASVFEYAAVAVNVGDGALARGSVHERRVVGHQPEVLFAGLDLAQVHRADGSVFDGDFVLLARAVVRDGQGVSGRAHGKSFPPAEPPDF